MIAATDGGAEGYVYAFEQMTGRVRWKHHVGRPVPSDVVRHGQLVYVLTQDDSLVALDIATGAVRWSFGPPEGPRFHIFVSSPIPVGDRVVIAARNGVVYAVEADSGRLAWQHDVGAAMTTPVATSHWIYVGIVNQNRVIALSATSGSPVAEARLGGSLTASEPPVVTDWGLCVVTGARLEFWTTDLERAVWQVQAPAPFGRSPVVWRDRLAGGTVRGQVVGYRASDGAPEFTVQLTGVVTGVIGVDDVLFVGTQEGTLYALRP